MEAIKNNFDNVLCEFGRVYKKKANPSVKVKDSASTYKYIKGFLPSEVNYKEFFHVIYLNAQNMILGKLFIFSRLVFEQSKYDIGV